MVPNFKKAAVATVTLALFSSVTFTSAAQAAADAIPLSPESTMSAFNCPSGGLGNINLSTLEFTPASAAEPCEFTAGYNSIAYNPIDARIYAANVAGSGVVNLVATDVRGKNLEAWPANANKKRQLITGTVAGSTGYPASIAINPVDGAAFVIDAGGRLYQLNLSTGIASSPIQTNPSVGGLAYMAFNPNGVLYGFSSGRGNLYTIDPATGATTTVLTDWRTGIPNNAGNIKSLTFDANGNMYLSGGTSVQGNEGNGIYSTKAADVLGNIAQFFITPLAPTYGSPWTGTQSAQANVSAVMITYGGLAVNFNTAGGVAISSSRFYSKTINESVTPNIVNPTISLPTPTRSGYTFNGWFTAATGGTLIGAAGASYTPYADASITMYAQWTEIPRATTPAATTAPAATTLATTGLDTAQYIQLILLLLALGAVAVYFAYRRTTED